MRQRTGDLCDRLYLLNGGFNLYCARLRQAISKNIAMKLLIVNDSVCVRGLLKRMLGGLCEAIYVRADGVSERSRARAEALISEKAA